MTKLKPVIYKGKKITFWRTSEHISKDFPTPHLIDCYINGKFLMTGFTKAECMRSVKLDEFRRMREARKVNRK